MRVTTDTIKEDFLGMFDEEGEEADENLKVRRYNAIKHFVDAIYKIKRETIMEAFWMCGIVKRNEVVSTELNEKLRKFFDIFDE